MHRPGHGPITGTVGYELRGLIHHPAAGMMGSQPIALPIGNDGRNPPMGTLHNIAGIATDFRRILRSLGHANFYFHFMHSPLGAHGRAPSGL